MHDNAVRPTNKPSSNWNSSLQTDKLSKDLNKGGAQNQEDLVEENLDTVIEKIEGNLGMYS